MEGDNRDVFVTKSFSNETVQFNIGPTTVCVDKKSARKIINDETPAINGPISLSILNPEKVAMLMSESEMAQLKELLTEHLELFDK